MPSQRGALSGVTAVLPVFSGLESLADIDLPFLFPGELVEITADGFEGIALVFNLALGPEPEPSKNGQRRAPAL